jgi:hypothetical protein
MVLLWDISQGKCVQIKGEITLSLKLWAFNNYQFFLIALLQ